MIRQSPFTIALIFAALALGGLVGMLLVEGLLDTLFLATATAPLAIGWFCRTRVRRGHGRSR